MRVKATNDFSYYRLMCLDGLSVEDFRALQEGKTIDMTKELYDKNKHLLEVVVGSKKLNASKGVKNGD